ncbi:MAG: hypothetical protein ACOC8A_00695 [bacterium]
MNTFVGQSVLLTVLAVLFGSLWAKAQGAAEPPPNAPAAVQWDAGQGRLSLRYHGTVVLDALVVARDQDGKETRGGVTMEPTVVTEKKVDQRLKLALAKPRDGVEVALHGTVTGSAEAFPAETPGEAQKRFPLVRNSVGLSRNLRSNALYDRRWDWVLIGPPDGATRITPMEASTKHRLFSWKSNGPGLELVFRPRFYQKHLGFTYYEPWTYKPWKGSVAGYCTWWSYRGNFTQETLDTMLEVFMEKHLPDFGYAYMQFDNCYQQGNGSAPWNWLHWNKRKYPGGWKYAMEAIRNAGMNPGI